MEYSPIQHGGVPVNVDFHRAGNSADCRLDGWSTQETDRVWSIGATSGLRMARPSGPGPLILDLEVAPTVHTSVLRGQLLRVRLAGRLLGSVLLMRRAVVRARIDPEVLGDAEFLDLRFEHPGWVRPAHLGFSVDERPLGVSFIRIRSYPESLLEPETSSQAYPVIELTPPPEAKSYLAADRTRQIYNFGQRGDVRPYLGEGWHRGEPTLTWTIADVAHIDLPAPAGRGPHVLRMNFAPLVIDGAVSGQGFTVLAHGVVLGQFHASTETTLVVPLPEELVRAGDTLPITLHLPDARRPNELSQTTDSRLLGLAFRSIEIEAVDVPPSVASLRGDHVASPTPHAFSARFLDTTPDALPAAIEQELGTSAVELLRSFESLGENCEFGIVQRKFGLEVLGLLRFGNVWLSSLLRALNDDFEAATQPSEMSVSVSPSAVLPEYLIELPRYGMRWHTFVRPADMDENAVLAREAVKLGYLRRRFLDGLRTGRKICLLKRPQALSVAEAMAVFTELNRRGPNTLLCVSIATDGRPAGSVDLLAPGLMRAHIAAFAPDDDVESADTADWLRVAANAVILDRQWRAANQQDAAQS
jgi:hypothetical protein